MNLVKHCFLFYLTFCKCFHYLSFGQIPKDIESRLQESEQQISLSSPKMSPSEDVCCAGLTVTDIPVRDHQKDKHLASVGIVMAHGQVRICSRYFWFLQVRETQKIWSTPFYIEKFAPLYRAPLTPLHPKRVAELHSSMMYHSRGWFNRKLLPQITYESILWCTHAQTLL